VIISPEMMLSKRFINGVLRKEEMTKHLLSMVIDEAHVVSHWGSDFRKKYGTLGILWALLPKGTPFVAMSATLGPRVRRDVMNKLQFDESDFLYLNLGNDRANVSIVVRAIQNPMNTYSDLDFLIHDNVKNTNDIKKAFVYADSVSVATDIPESFRGVIWPYSAAYSDVYRENVMAWYKTGVVHILICTKAAGMVRIFILNTEISLKKKRDATYLTSTPLSPMEASFQCVFLRSTSRKGCTRRRPKWTCCVAC
jgi:superfamily II DNA helicase RecQ